MRLEGVYWVWRNNLETSGMFTESYYARLVADAWSEHRQTVGADGANKAITKCDNCGNVYGIHGWRGDDKLPSCPKSLLTPPEVLAVKRLKERLAAL